MKRITKQAVSLLLCGMGTILCDAQESHADRNALYKAEKQLIEGQLSYNPREAVATYTHLASKGNARAMNGLGLIYFKGITTPVNETEGIKWLEKAGENGYAKSWYNLALLYKEGIGKAKDIAKAVSYFEKAAKAGYNKAWQQWAEIYKDGIDVPQDYTAAMDIFRQGAENGNVHCLYSQGYLYYKGFGCQQNYSKALELFESASQKGDKYGMYMLGLCYRNGYGTSIDNEKAKYWLTKSAALGVKSSDRELAESQPENAEPNQAKTVSRPFEEVTNINSTEAPKTFIKVKQLPLNNSLTGNYRGSLIRYDWSGQNIISSIPLEINFNQNGKKLVGNIKEKTGQNVKLKAELQNNKIVFEDSKIELLDYYHKSAPTPYDIKEAQIQLIQADDALFLAGNIQLYDSKRHENEKPMYLIMERSEAVNSTKESLSSVLIYPNPVLSEFNLSFDLDKDMDVSMEIYSMNGVNLYSREWKQMKAGHQSKTINLNLPGGYYPLRLKYNNEIKTTILIKQ